VIAALPQDKSSTTNALAQHQPPSGTEMLAFAQPIPSDPTVFNVQPQDFGMETTVFAKRTESGTIKIAFALLDFLDLNAFHAHHQDSGTMLQANVFAPRTESGTEKTASVPQDFSVPTANHAHPQENG
jgi:hypothetical protein